MWIGLFIVARKIMTISATAIESLDKFIQSHEKFDKFDFFFIDADKVNYLEYLGRFLKLAILGGFEKIVTIILRHD